MLNKHNRHKQMKCIAARLLVKCLTICEREIYIINFKSLDHEARLK